MLYYPRLWKPRIMAFASLASPHEPLSEINTTPLIDVLLVLFIVFVMAIPLAPDSLDVELPRPGPTAHRPHPVSNQLVIETAGDLRWNGRAVDDGELAGLLAQVRGMAPQPEVRFQPEPNASYDRAARVLLIVKQSRISNFGFVDNEKYAEFSRGN
jgi:biopolymer transport protein ExbD